MKKSIIGGLCVLFAALLVALPLGAAAAEETIKLGVTEPLSGTFKDIGERYLDGVM
jgi:hypothetical protein